MAYQCRDVKGAVLHEATDMGDARDWHERHPDSAAVTKGAVVLIAAPPCTDFAVSGAQYWPDKDADGRTEASVHLVRQVLRCVDYLRPDFWAVENPVGRIGRLVPALGPARLAFDPWEFAGWTDPDAATLARLDTLRARGPGPTAPADLALVRDVGAYTKRTLLWGSFALPVRRPVAPVATSSQGSWLQSLGGTSEATKAARSLTPSASPAPSLPPRPGRRWRQPSWTCSPNPPERTAMAETLFNLAVAAAMLWLAMAPLPRGHRCHRRDDP